MDVTSYIFNPGDSERALVTLAPGTEPLLLHE
jgi:hypothetical protein